MNFLYFKKSVNKERINMDVVTSYWMLDYQDYFYIKFTTRNISNTYEVGFLDREDRNEALDNMDRMCGAVSNLPEPPR